MKYLKGAIGIRVKSIFLVFVHISEKNDDLTILYFWSTSIKSITIVWEPVKMRIVDPAGLMSGGNEWDHSRCFHRRLWVSLLLNSLQNRKYICVVVCLKRYMKTTHPSPVVADRFTFAAHDSSEKQHSQHSCHPGKFVKCFMTVHIYMFFVFRMTIYIYVQCLQKWNLVLRTWGQKLFNGEKKDFWVKKGPKKDPL